MLKVNGFLSILVLSFFMVACGGGSGGGNSGGGGDVGGPGSPSAISVDPTTSAGFKFDNVITLYAYENLVVDSSLSASIGSQKTGSGGQVVADSNLLALNEDGQIVFPIENVVPLIVDYVALSPNQDKIYFYVSEDYGSTGPFLTDANDDGAFSFGVPLIGPPLNTEVPFSEEVIAELYGEGVRGYYDYYACEPEQCRWPDWVIYSNNGGATQEIDRFDLSAFFEAIEAGEYMACSLLELDRNTEELSCLGGLDEISAAVRFPGSYQKVDLSVHIAKRQGMGSDYYGNLKNFESIRDGLKPVQFDMEGNIYTLSTTKSFDSEAYPTSFYNKGLVKIDENDQFNFIIDDALDDLSPQEFFVMDTDVVAVVYSIADESGLRLGIYGDFGLISVLQNAYSYNDASIFKADMGSTLIVDNELVAKAQDETEGLYGAPISWQGIKPISTLMDEGKLYGCLWDNSAASGYYQYKLYSVYPYVGAPILDHCDIQILDQGYNVRKVTIETPNFGFVDTIEIQSLNTGEIKRIFTADDYSQVPRYSIQSMAVEQGVVAFSAYRNSTPVGAIIGEIDINKLYADSSEDEYLTITGVDSSVAATNKIKNIMLLPELVETVSQAAPYLEAIIQNDKETSHIGLVFSEAMDKASVVDNLRLTERIEDTVALVSYIPFWTSDRELFLVPSSISSPIHQPFRVGPSYTVRIDTAKAKATNGRYMDESEEPNAKHVFDFIPDEGHIH